MDPRRRSGASRGSRRFRTLPDAGGVPTASPEAAGTKRARTAPHHAVAGCGSSIAAAGASATGFITFREMKV